MWWIKWKAHGKVYRENSRTTKESEARQLLKQREGAAVEGRPILPYSAKVRVQELMEDLLTEYRANSRPSLDRLEHALKHLVPFFGHMRAITVTPADLNSYITRRMEKGASLGTVDRELGILRRAFSLAVASDKLPRVPRFPRLRANNVRTGFFEDDQIRAVLRFLPEYVRPVIAFAAVTGWRIPSEVLPLQWRQVCFESGTVRLDPGTTKSGEGRMFPVIPPLKAILEAQEVRRVELARGGRIVPWVFHRDGEEIRGFRKAWKTACRKAGVPDRIPHDLRRTCARALERAGVPRTVAMALIGHRTESMYRRYVIVEETMIREGADKLSRFYNRDQTLPPGHGLYSSQVVEGRGFEPPTSALRRQRSPN